MATAAGPIGPGNRWYKVRVRPQYGLMKSVGVRGFVDPADPSKLWVDWDASYKEHMAAWDREARVRREVEIRKGGIDGALERIANPLAGKLRPEEEALVQERLEPEARREREQREYLLAQLRGGDGPPASDEDYKELLRRIDEQRRIQRKGRKTTATVVAREETGRTFATIPLVLLDFESRAVPCASSTSTASPTPRTTRWAERSRCGSTARPRTGSHPDAERECGRRDSNPQALRHRHLKPACLPIPPRPQRRHSTSTMPRRAGGLV